MSRASDDAQARPLENLDQWDEDVRRRYPPPSQRAGQIAGDPAKEEAQFRDYRAEVRPCVKEAYRLNHKHQTLEFVRRKRAEYLPPRRREMAFGKRSNCSTRSSTIATRTSICRRSSMPCKRPRKTAPTAILAGWCWSG